MSIYGNFKEHPEYPITDERRFTIEILPHKFGEPSFDSGEYHTVSELSKCTECGYKRNAPFHVEAEHATVE